MKQAANNREPVVVNIRSCRTGEDGYALLEVDTTQGPMRLSVARSALHHLLKMTAPATLTSAKQVGGTPGDGVPPIVRFLTTSYARRGAENEESSAKVLTE